MKIKLDENMPTDLVQALAQLGHDTDTVVSEGLTGSDDDRVWEAAQDAGRFFITQDLRFSDSRHYLLGSHHGILLLRLLDPDRLTAVAKVEEIFKTEGNLERCYVVVTERKCRVQRPS